MSELPEAYTVGEGPYGIKSRNHWWHVDGLGEENRMNQWAYKIGAEWWASQLNSAYAAGRASRDGFMLPDIPAQVLICSDCGNTDLASEWTWYQSAETGRVLPICRCGQPTGYVVNLEG